MSRINERGAEFDRYVERFARQMGDLGMPRMAARVLIVLLVADRSRTAAELGEELGASAPAISGAVSYLGRVGILEREREPGQRRDRYWVDENVWYLTLVRRTDLLRQLEDLLNEGVHVVGDGTRAGGRLRESARFWEFLRGELPQITKKWQESDTPTSPGGEAATGR
ncbi:MarR family transcriptional regulator [Actinoalloteichus sp. AHMU CJ021]|uniref:MarR family protein n=1 Tax=Actinoalloteichus caeruleus DSM 43889 TaxID=1120930 RepID=A0ABT1JH60_ACTCY|nr:MarR family transcriptional regulator [Actinoalloteichus caeruleus]AUS77878.1 MarR family transcriptional regulator [Actinoalloteichus sp. AHMU CJ021]MCP2331835.1 MarR family protein [Actinoalloteichus caeruleus DSM 43889]